MFENNTKLCPVKAFIRYRDSQRGSLKNLPAFRDDMGKAYRKAKFNADLKKLLGPHIKYGKISTHSFRCGLATLLAEEGYSDPDIQAMGRWSSNAFLTYIKRPRLTRVRVARKLSKRVNV